MEKSNPYQSQVVRVSIMILLAVAVLAAVIILTPAAYPRQPSILAVAVIMAIIILVDRFDFYLSRFGGPVNGADYTGIFAVFATLVMGPVAGASVVLLENIYVQIKRLFSRDRKRMKAAEFILIISHNYASGFLAIVYTHLVVLLTRQNTWTMILTLPVIIVLGDVVQLNLFSCLRLLLARYRGTELPPRLQKMRLLRDMANSFMYYIYIAIGPVLLYYSFMNGGHPGVILALIILIPSQATGMLYMQLKDKQQELFTDELTGMCNSLKFRSDMDRQLAVPSPYVLIMLDLDDFKKINDQHGHLVGNQALIFFGRQLMDLAEENQEFCQAYRMHGDEFIIRVTDAARAPAITALLNERVARLSFRHESKTISLSCSGGGALIAAGTPVRQALQRIDEAMYQVKKTNSGHIICDEALVPG